MRVLLRSLLARGCGKSLNRRGGGCDQCLYQEHRAMIVVIRKAEKPQRQRAPGLRGHVAAAVALVALAIAIAAWFWTTRQPPQAEEASLALSYRVIVVGCGAFIA